MCDNYNKGLINRKMPTPHKAAQTKGEINMKKQEEFF